VINEDEEMEWVENGNGGMERGVRQQKIMTARIYSDCRPVPLAHDVTSSFVTAAGCGS